MLSSPVLMLFSPVLMLSSPVLMLSSPVLMLSSPVLMLSSPVLMLSSPVLMLSSPNLNLFPYLHRFDKNILGDHHSSKAIWLIQLHLHVPMTSLRGKLCELKVWAEFFFFEGSNSAHNNQQANSHGGELPECSYPSLVCWESSPRQVCYLDSSSSDSLAPAQESVWPLLSTQMQLPSCRTSVCRSKIWLPTVLKV